jgi:hypothetical protein
VKVILAAITGNSAHLTETVSGHQYRAMRVSLVGAAWFGLWLAASPAFAQISGAPDVRAGDKAPAAGSNTAPSPPTPSTPVTSPNEMSHQAMVEEQERRDREEAAERDRDDQG